MDYKKVKDLFEKIEKVKNLEELKAIEVGAEIPAKFKISEDKYPKINFSLSDGHIYGIEYFDENWTLHQSKFMTPLEQLLYAVLWKQGDLPKVKHIIEGIISAGNPPNSEKKDGLVFYHFGRHLANNALPIIDQHTIRAFLVFSSKNEDEAKENAQLDLIGKEQTEAIDRYIKWCQDCGFTNDTDLMFAVDRLIMAIGKAIKTSLKN